MMHLVTSFNHRLYDLYGRRMVQEFSMFAERDIALTVVYEGALTDEMICSDRVKFVNFQSLEHSRFLNFFGKLYEAHGYRLVRDDDGRVVGIQNDYRFNAVRFSFKIFSLLQIRDQLSCSKNFAWIDADLRCLKPFGNKDLLPFFPDENQLMSYLGRDFFPKPNPYSECGFLGFNAGHPKTWDYLRRVADIYRTGEIFSLREWHDSWVWDEVRREYESQSISFKNISGDASKYDHPFINSGLGEFFDHLKGEVRKVQGRSSDLDYK